MFGNTFKCRSTNATIKADVICKKASQPLLDYSDTKHIECILSLIWFTNHRYMFLLLTYFWSLAWSDLTRRMCCHSIVRHLLVDMRSPSRTIDSLQLSPVFPVEYMIDTYKLWKWIFSTKIHSLISVIFCWVPQVQFDLYVPKPIHVCGIIYFHSCKIPLYCSNYRVHMVINTIIWHSWCQDRGTEFPQ